MPFDENQFKHPCAPACNRCKHFTMFSNPPTCKAFPRGIPTAIIKCEEKHKKPVRGDHGIQFEAI